MKLLPSTFKHTRIQALHSYGWRFTKDYGHRNKKTNVEKNEGSLFGEGSTPTNTEQPALVSLTLQMLLICYSLHSST